MAVADLPIGFTQAHRTWGFELCFLYLRDVKSHPWNQKRVYRIYRELELNLDQAAKEDEKRDA